MFESKLSKYALLLPGLALITGFGAAAATATQTGGNGAQQQIAQSTQQSADLSDEKIEAFVDARESVVEISRQWEDRLNNADTQEEINSLQQQAQEEMVAAVRDEGLTVEEYNMIVDAMQTDPDLQERVNEMMIQ